MGYHSLLPERKVNVSLPLIILASARSDGDTRTFTDRVFANVPHRFVDLLDYPISPYTYSGKYPMSDQYFILVDKLLLHETIVFATPVYWYAMSGLLKSFFDRFTDLVTIRKTLGRQLKGRKILVIAVGADEDLPAGFEVPFQRTANYLDMTYDGLVYHSTKHGCGASREEVEDFLIRLK